MKKSKQKDKLTKKDILILKELSTNFQQISIYIQAKLFPTEFITTTEIVEKYNVSRQVVYCMRNEGKLNVIFKRKVLFFDAEETNRIFRAYRWQDE